MESIRVSPILLLSIRIDPADVAFFSNFEWADGYETRFGVTYVDYSNGQTRYPKQSAGVIQETFTALCCA